MGLFSSHPKSTFQVVRLSTATILEIWGFGAWHPGINLNTRNLQQHSPYFVILFISSPLPYV